MLEKRVIPFGEKMTERHCRLAGYIGQVAVMTRLGSFYEYQGLKPTTNRHSDRLRLLCRDFNDGKFLDVEARLLGDHDAVLRDACHKIGFIRQSATNRSVLDGDAQAALQYSAGQAEFRLPQDYTAPFNRLVDYMADRALTHIKALDDINIDDTDQESHHISRANSDIAFEVKYLQPEAIL